MEKSLFIILAVFFITTAPAQTKAGGVTLPNTISFEGEKLVLNGVGVREKFWMEIYAGALYLHSRSSDANAIINANEANGNQTACLI